MRILNGQQDAAAAAWPKKNKEFETGRSTDTNDATAYPVDMS
jgi:hypothetical protein